MSPEYIAELEDRIQEELMLSEVTQKTKLHTILWEFYDKITQEQRSASTGARNG